MLEAEQAEQCALQVTVLLTNNRTKPNELIAEATEAASKATTTMVVVARILFLLGKSSRAGGGVAAGSAHLEVK